MMTDLESALSERFIGTLLESEFLMSCTLLITLTVLGSIMSSKVSNRLGHLRTPVEYGDERAIEVPFEVALVKIGPVVSPEELLEVVNVEVALEARAKPDWSFTPVVTLIW
jgi:hypothetical protein